MSHIPILKEKTLSEILLEELKYLQNNGIDRINISEDAIYNLIDFEEQETEKSLMSKTTKYYSEDLVNPPTIALPPHTDKSFLLNVLKAQINCNSVVKSHLNTGAQYVLGDGNPNANLMVIGEAPGAEEEKVGKPFVGRSGKLLTTLLTKYDFTRFSNTYVSNIMLWRPQLEGSGNRPPTTQEMDYCIPFLKAQIDIIQPKAILALGATSVTGLFGKDNSRKMSDVRGKFQVFNKIPTMITFHPSYVLRCGPGKIQDTFENDIQMAKALIDNS